MVLDHYPRAWPAPRKHHRVVASGVDTGHAGWKGQLHSQHAIFWAVWMESFWSSSLGRGSRLRSGGCIATGHILSHGCCVQHV